MCKYELVEGKTFIPLTVSWTKQESDITVQTEQPDGYSYYHSMNYYTLNTAKANWLHEHSCKYTLAWCDDSKNWYLIIDNPHLAVLYKLTFQR